MQHLEELWVPIEGFPNYEVSNYGRVVNIKLDRDLKQYENSDGYYTVRLSKDGKRKTFLVHDLVAKAFFVNYSAYVLVEHVNDKNRHDNSVLNLTLAPLLSFPEFTVKRGGLTYGEKQ